MLPFMLIDDCNRPNVCIPHPSPQIHMSKPNPQCDGILRCGLWEVVSS